MLRRALLFLTLPMAGAVAQSNDLTLDITTANETAFRILRTPADSTAPVQIGNGHLTIRYKTPVRPKVFTVVPVDSSTFVSVVVLQNDRQLASGTGKYVRIETETDRFVRLEAGLRVPSELRDHGELGATASTSTAKCDPAAPIYIIDGVPLSAPCVKPD
jgi:hypothetical protein